MLNLELAKRRILVVEDEEVFRNVIRRELEKEGFDVTVATDGRQAREIFGMESFDAVLSDINMPSSTVSGIDLLKFIRSAGATPVILMTGFSELAETKQAFDLGAAGFLAKPFKRADLVTLLRKTVPPVGGMLPIGDAEIEDSLDADYCRIPIDDFLSGREIKFSIFIRLAANKYVKIAHLGEDLPAERIQSYKEKSIQFLHMHHDDFRKYLEFNRVVLKAAESNPRVPRARKLQLLRHANEVVLEHFHHNEIALHAFEDAKAVLDTTISVLSEDPDALALLEVLNGHSETLYAQSLGVSLFAVLVAKKLKWEAPQTIYRISIAGLFHDIGKKEIDPAIVNKPAHLRTAADIKILETHPARGAAILSGLPQITEDVIQIVLQHHENNAGTGYPSRLQKLKIHPVARLIAACDELVKMLVIPTGQERQPISKVIERLYVLESERLDQQYLNALAEIFHQDPVDICRRHGLRLRAG